MNSLDGPSSFPSTTNYTYNTSAYMNNSITANGYPHMYTEDTREDRDVNCCYNADPVKLRAPHLEAYSNRPSWQNDKVNGYSKKTIFIILMGFIILILWNDNQRLKRTLEHGYSINTFNSPYNLHSISRTFV